jgi:CBS domain-containing protein
VVDGIAAFLGAGYRVPLSAVMFVAEATGRPGFIVPGLIAAVVAELVMGDSSVSPYQRRRHRGHLEERAELPVAQALVTDPATVDADSSLADFYSEHVAMARPRAVPVVEDRSYLGMVLLDDVLAVDPTEWIETSVASVMRTDLPTARPGDTLGLALAAMVDASAEQLAVVGPSGELHGVVSRMSILDLQELLDQLEGPDES